METYSLLELNHKIKTVLDDNLDSSYWVVAEIAELRTNYKGHCYLELVDKDEDQVLAKNRATIWAYTFRGINAWFLKITGSELAQGMKVLCKVKVTFHEVYGMSLNITDVDPKFTLGERAAKKQEILQHLEEDGVINMNKEIPLPIVPQKIAIISSETAAGYQDFMSQLQSNQFGYMFHTTLFNSVMQGNQAPESIITALHRIHASSKDFDLTVIIRGGGAQLDLECFDNYEVALHTAQFPIPVLTGIGHERDETITDLVANTALKTPTAVAEFLISGMYSFEEKLVAAQKTLSDKSRGFIQSASEKLNFYNHNIQKASENLIKEYNYSLNDLKNKIEFITKNIIKKELDFLNSSEKLLSSMNPKKVIERGYTYTEINGQNINKADQINKGSQIRTISKKLDIISTIDKVEKNAK
ncbi:exodeoxyribonuclease VII large subunit [Mangrovivirga sp. M17]|uniref:Exodeoxyribonuclease 7 large subunit n=1 Tax=Mangrovivirga halotolerans TaxID=2993936 RepID=A0ABT3RTX1_9BACT|nr:exodeoxyribonuclease VII large subunit [Mangrovivirga halotolerans]MCX2745234.1 exodeoxyribonuclease VII large subunit [Mangrovivirga halotolerans]